MTTLSDSSTQVTDEANAKSVYVLAAVVAAIAFLFFAAMISNDARVGDGSTDGLSNYITGDTQNLPPATSEYTAP